MVNILSYCFYISLLIMPFASPNRILVIKLRHHGDVLLSTPVVAALKRRFPHCEVDMLVYAKTADIIRDNQIISNIFTIDRAWKKQGIKMRLQHEIALFKALKARSYDWVFNLSDQWRAAVIAKFCAEYSATLAYDKRDNLLWRFCHRFVNPDLGAQQHVIERHLSTLVPLMRREECGKPEVVMMMSEQVRHSLDSKLRAQGWAGEAYVLVHPGSRWLFKCWEDDKNAAVVQHLLNCGHHVVLTAAPDKNERQMLDEILARLKIPDNTKVWDLGGKLNLRELAVAIEGADMFFGVDSVPMHIAAALNKPQVALFGPSWVEHWRPYSEAAEVLWVGDFGECIQPDSIDTNDPTRRLGAIPFEAVWDKIVQKLRQAHENKKKLLKVE